MPCNNYCANCTSLTVLNRMTAVYCLKKLFIFKDTSNQTVAVSNYFRLVLWIMVIHLLLVSLNNHAHLGLLYGPFFLSIAFKISNREITRPILFLQTIPFLVLILLLYRDPEQDPLRFLAGISAVSSSAYSVFFWNLFKNEKQKANQNWLLFAVVFLSLLAVVLTLIVVQSWLSIPYPFNPIFGLVVLLLSMVVVLIKIVLDDKTQFVEEIVLDEPSVCAIPQQPNANLELIEKIENYFAHSDQYLSSSFDFEQLSNEIAIPKPLLSAIINKDMNKNFYLLLAEHRIDHAKELLIKQDYLFKIESVIYECGYNSKSSFHKHFKHFVGTTPSSFRYNYPRK